MPRNDSDSFDVNNYIGKFIFFDNKQNPTHKYESGLAVLSNHQFIDS